MTEEQPTWYMLGMTPVEVVEGSEGALTMARYIRTRSGVLKAMVEMWKDEPVKLAYFSAMYMAEATVKNPKMVGDENPLYVLGR